MSETFNNATLTPEEMTICRECFACGELDKGKFICLQIADPSAASESLRKIGYQVKKDADGKTLCPRGVLNDSRKSPLSEQQSSS
jgi:hypothetical protein